MIISMSVIKFIANDILLILFKKLSDKYYISECYSHCCNFKWNKMIITKKSITNDSLI